MSDVDKGNLFFALKWDALLWMVLLSL